MRHDLGAAAVGVAAVRGVLVELPLVFVGHVEVHESRLRLLLDGLLDLCIVVQEELEGPVLVGLRVLRHDQDPSVRVGLVDGPHGPQQTMQRDGGDVLPVLLLAVEALEVRGPVLVVIVPGRNEGDVALARVLRDVGDQHRVLGEGTAGSVLTLHPEALDCSEPVRAATIPTFQGKVPTAPSDPSKAGRLEMSEVLGVVAGGADPGAELRGPVRRNHGNLVAKTSQRQVDLVDPCHPDEVAGANGVHPNVLANLEIRPRLLHDVAGAEERRLCPGEVPEDGLVAHLGPWKFVLRCRHSGTAAVCATRGAADAAR
mmetsp:Transcript_69240/g.206130  ORF Transcript_69240/g.206130 Transcript_69240/m.206130 type:complete len:314 (+) Transcript_69240:328-1269(+)